MPTSNFISFIKDLIDISDEKASEIEEFGIKKSISANTILFNADAPFLKLFFIQHGLFRAYRIIDGKDFTFFFFTSGEFATDYESFLNESKSPLFFEALVDSDYIEFNKSTISRLYTIYPKFERVGKLMAEKAYLSATNRLKEFQTEPLEKRYLNLLTKNPKLFQQVPQYHIASYLGVNPQSLSRVRAKLQNKVY